MGEQIRNMHVIAGEGDISSILNKRARYLSVGLVDGVHTDMILLPKKDYDNLSNEERFPEQLRPEQLRPHDKNLGNLYSHFATKGIRIIGYIPRILRRDIHFNLIIGFKFAFVGLDPRDVYRPGLAVNYLDNIVQETYEHLKTQKKGE